MADYIYNITRVDGAPVNRKALSASIGAAFSVPHVRLQTTGGTTLTVTLASALNPAEILTLDGLVATAISSPEPLTTAKKHVNKKVDALTSSTLGDGFSYGGVTISLSENSLTRIIGTGLYATTAPGQAGLPVLWPSIDDTAVLTLANISEWNDFYEAVFIHVRAVEEAAMPIKAQVGAATDISTLQAIENSL